MQSGSVDMLQRRSGVPVGVEPRAWLLQSRFFVYTWYNVNGSFLNVLVVFICSCRQNRKIFFYLSIHPCSSTWQFLNSESAIQYLFFIRYRRLRIRNHVVLFKPSETGKILYLTVASSLLCSKLLYCKPVVFNLFWPMDHLFFKDIRWTTMLC